MQSKTKGKQELFESEGRGLRQSITKSEMNKSCSQIERPQSWSQIGLKEVHTPENFTLLVFLWLVSWFCHVKLVGSKSTSHSHPLTHSTHRYMNIYMNRHKGYTYTHTHTQYLFDSLSPLSVTSEFWTSAGILNGNRPERVAHSVPVSKRPTEVSKTDLTGICSLVSSVTLNSARAQQELRHTHTYSVKKRLTDDSQKHSMYSMSYSQTHWTDKYIKYIWRGADGETEEQMGMRTKRRSDRTANVQVTVVTTKLDNRW